MSLRRIVKEGIDMQRMAMIINRKERQFRSQLESDKGNSFSNTLISHFLYGAVDGSDLNASMDVINHYAILRSWSSQKWADLLLQ
jgi:Zn-dependent M16 (insulinase) family peptidase